MKKKLTLGTAIGMVVIAVALTCAVTWATCISSFNSRLGDFSKKESTYKKVAEIDQIVRAKYIHEIDQDRLQEGLAIGYIYGLNDKYSRYLTADEYKEMMQGLDGKFTGIGVNVVKDEETGGILVVNVMPNSPAAKSGVKAGDLIVKVGDEETQKLGYEVAVNKMLGKVGTTATFTVLRNGEYITFSIVRQVFDATTVTSSMVAGNVGYIKITEFDQSTVEEFSNAVNNLKSSGAAYIVFDVRNNPGGELNSICSVLDMLLPEGPIIRINSKGGEVETINSDAAQENLPMAVLINNNTYSAAELFAAALKDYGKALLVGETTHGKGTMQTIIPLSDGSAVSISTAMYNPPFSDNYEGKGVEPQIKVGMPENLKKNFYLMSADEDLQLQRAIEELKKGTKPIPPAN